MRTVIVTGGFDPLHSGHIDYFNAARELGDRLWVGLNSDDWLTRKKGQPFMSYQERTEIIRNLKMVDRVIPVMGDDRTDDATGAIFYAQSIGATDIIFANGGDRDASNSPEEDFYQHDTTVRFVYGVGGDFKKNSSSWILNEWSTPKTNRPWGYYKVLQSNSPEVKLKELVVNPGSSLSMQRHQYRAEHWFVSEGTATVYTINASSDLELLNTLEKHQSIHINKKQWHQLCNKTNKPVKIIEIQYGDNCIEADIERL
jgi:cytidyltransferase-like protein